MAKTLSHKRQISAMRSLYEDHGMELSQPEKIFKDMRKRISKVGVFSLSESCDNELMWAHYGASHKGIVIGFNYTSSCKLNNPRHCIPVTYAMNKPAFSSGFTNEVEYQYSESGLKNTSRVSFEDDVFRSTISSKTPAWQYEKEWRYVEEIDGLFNFPGILNHIVFGLNMKEERRVYYRMLVEEYIHNDVEFFEVRATSSLSGFEIIKCK